MEEQQDVGPSYGNGGNDGYEDLGEEALYMALFRIMVMTHMVIMQIG